MSAPKRESVPAGWSNVVLVCGKCSKKVGGGFGPKGKTGLAKLLHVKGKPRRQPYGVVETKCLKLCPKGAVVVVDGRHPGDWLLLRPGTPVEDVAARLGLTLPSSS